MTSSAGRLAKGLCSGMQRACIAGIFAMVIVVPVSAEPLLSDSFADQHTQQRYDNMLHRLRCLVCQNQSLADSAADLAGDLRSDVYNMLAAGKSDQQIIEELTSRYGDFVVYKPPLRASTVMLWFMPPMLLVLAGLMVWRALSGAVSDEESGRQR